MGRSGMEWDGVGCGLSLLGAHLAHSRCSTNICGPMSLDTGILASLMGGAWLGVFFLVSGVALGMASLPTSSLRIPEDKVL